MLFGFKKLIFIEELSSRWIAKDMCPQRWKKLVCEKHIEWKYGFKWEYQIKVFFETGMFLLPFLTRWTSSSSIPFVLPDRLKASISPSVFMTLNKVFNTSVFCFQRERILRSFLLLHLSLKFFQIGWCYPKRAWTWQLSTFSSPEACSTILWLNLSQGQDEFL